MKITDLKFNTALDIPKYLDTMLGHAVAHVILSRRTEEAHTYVQKYGVGLSGDNVWHIILDDAIKLRQRVEVLESRMGD